MLPCVLFFARKLPRVATLAIRTDAGIVAAKRVRKVAVRRHVVKRDDALAALQRATNIATEMRRRKLTMIGFEQQLAIAGPSRERHQFAGAVARQRRLAAQIGVNPKAPFGLERCGAVAEFLTDFAGFGVGVFGLNACRPCATTDAEPSFSQNSSCRRRPFRAGSASASLRPAEKCAIAST